MSDIIYSKFIEIYDEYLNAGFSHDEAIHMAEQEIQYIAKGHK